MRPWQLPVATLLGVALLTAGCSAAAPTSGRAPTATTVNPLVMTAVADYKAYASGQIDELVRLTSVFTTAVRAGDLPAARAAYAPSRVPWERIEPLAGLVEEIDGAIDARADNFASVNDPGFTGWHRLEYLLFVLDTTAGGAPFADKLDAELATLKTEFATLEIKPVELPVGAAELIEEVSQGKITGEEDRYSKTDLWDFNANLEGSKAAIERLAPALRAADPALLSRIESGFADLQATLAPLREGDGWKRYCQQDDPFPSPLCTGVTVTPETITRLKAQLAGLSENVSRTAGALGLT